MEWTEAGPGSHEIDGQEVHLWRFPSGTADQLATTLGELLAPYTGSDPTDVEISTGAHGKPELADPAGGIHFNLSHSGDWSVVAVARVAVGVDIERIDPRRPTTRLADRFLTAAERELVQARAGSHGDAAFFIAWSRKEAYLKAVGVGLSVPFSHVDSAGARLPELDEQGRQPEGTTPWAVAEFFVDDAHPGALVARTEQLALRSFTLRRSEA